MNYFARLFFIIAFCSLTAVVLAQKSPKFGYINLQELISAMPETDSAQKKVDNITKELSAHLESMQVEFNRKENLLNEERTRLTPLIIQTRESELNDLSRRIQAYNQSASQELQVKQNELFQPVLAKARKCIDDLSREGGFTMIFQTEALLYTSPDMVDILPLAKARLGIKNVPAPADKKQ